MSELFAHRPTWTEINLENLAYNFNSVKNFIGDSIKYMAVVKADAYGHGAVECAKKLETARVDWFAVVLAEEGLELRKNGIQKPILCLGSFWHGQENLLLENDITPVVYQPFAAQNLNLAAAAKGVVAKVHIKIDTGMGRIGVRFDEVEEFVKSLKSLKNLSVEGLMTHFAAADNLSENEFTNLQIKRFEQAAEIFLAHGFEPKYFDLANSPGAVAHAGARGNMVRLGGVLYGLGGDVLPKEIEKPNLKPVLSLHTKIAHLKTVPRGETVGYGRIFAAERDSVIATIPIGYEDGYRRALSNCGRVIVNGFVANVVGRISMDWTLIDVTDLPQVNVNDEVILIGGQNGLIIQTEDLAKQVETISYEITCGINRRVTRKYVGS